MESSTITSLVAPFLGPLTTQNGRRNSSMVNVDTALGAAVTFGFSLAILRLTAHTLKQHDHLTAQDKDKEQKKSLFVTFLHAILLRNLFQRKFDGDSVDKETIKGDAYFSSLKHSVNITKRDDKEAIYSGSCHCKSIAFTLRTKRNLKALDCTGKIRYPHIITTASEFQLVKGSAHLNIYYVSLPNADENNQNQVVTSHNTDTNAAAAHAFCNRCGVHIFRAPDSRTNTLEVNANCFDSSLTHEKEDLNKLSITFYESERKLGGGKAIANQWNTKTPNYERGVEKDGLLSSSIHSDDVLPSPTSQKYRGKFSTSPAETLSTSMLSNSSQSFLCEPGRIDQESSSMDSSSQGSNNNGYGISSWAVGPSLRSPSVDIDAQKTVPRLQEGSNGHSSSDASIHAPVLQHQLKYYMKRHLSPGSTKEK